MKIWIINFIIITFCFPLGAQKMTKSEKIKREAQLLKTYKDLDRSKQIDVCKDLIGTWYDTVKYKMKMVHNQEGDSYEYKTLNHRIASVLEDKTDRYNKKILFFEPKSGKISKVIDLKKQNPYSKSKEPRLDEKLKYTSEYMDHIPPLDEKGKKHEISKFISWDNGGWQGDHFVWCFRKYAISKRQKVIDEWNTIMIFDTLGNTIMNHEFNGHSFGYDINNEGSYFVIHFWVEGWEGGGEFFIYEVKSMEKIYSYKVDSDDKRLNGAGFVKHSNNIIDASVVFPSHKNPSPEEKIIIDIANRIEYKYLFSGEQIDEVFIKWNNKYKTHENLLNFFDFTKRKF